MQHLAPLSIKLAISAWVPNETQKNFTRNFEKYEEVQLDEAI